RLIVRRVRDVVLLGQIGAPFSEHLGEALIVLFQVEAGAIETLKEFAGAESEELASESRPKVRVRVMARQLVAVVDDVLGNRRLQTFFIADPIVRRLALLPIQQERGSHSFLEALQPEEVVESSLATFQQVFQEAVVFRYLGSGFRIRSHKVLEVWKSEGFYIRLEGPEES